MGNKLGFYLPAIRCPTGYCIHKYKFNNNGLLTKLELFAYFPIEILDTVIENTEELEIAKAGTYPRHFHHKGKYRTLHQVVVMWNKAPRLIKCYKQVGDFFKLEVTAANTKGRGKKFLEPIATLNSLGALMKMLTSNANTIHNIRHDSFLFIPEFLLDCKNEYIKHNTTGQLRLLNKQKLRADLEFDLKQAI